MIQFFRYRLFPAINFKIFKLINSFFIMFSKTYFSALELFDKKFIILDHSNTVIGI